MRLFLSSKTFFAAVSGFCLLLIGLTWSQVVHHVVNDKYQTIEAAVQRNSNLAVSLDQYATRTIRNADGVLQLVRLEYERNGKNIRFDELFRRGIIDTADINGVLLMDKNGDFMATNLKLAGTPFPNFADRDYFKFHIVHKDSLHISEPIISRTIGKPVIVISRRISGADGGFAGVVALQIKPSVFTRFYAKANLRQHDIVSFISPTGITYARRTGQKESCGEDISRSPLFLHVAKSPVNHYFARDAIRDIPTYFSYRKLESYPVIATVGSAEDELLLYHYSRARREYLFAAFATLLLLLFLALMLVSFIYRKKFVNKLQESESRYRSIFEKSNEAIILLQKDGTIVTMNEAGYRLFHLQKTEQIVAAKDLYYAAEPCIGFTADELAKGNNSESEIRFTRLDGTAFNGEIVHSSYSSENNSTKNIVLIRDISLRKVMEDRLLQEQKRYQRKLTRQIILAQEREREVIGHELHDNVNQVLTTVKLYLDLALHDPQLRDEMIPKSIFHLKNSINEIRNLSHALSAPTLGTKSLVDSVRALVETVASSARINIDFDASEYKISLHKDQKLAIYRILQEQLTNIVKHAQANSVTIKIGQTEEATEISIGDDGRGFCMANRTTGIGFNNMRSRAKVFNGKLQINSAPGEGCRIYVWLPIVAKDAGLQERSASAVLSGD